MRLGPYELVARIGAGGMGEVWAARRSSVASGLLAIKRLPESVAGDPTYRRLLLDEARLSMLLTHRNIVHVFDAGEADGEAYIAMEYVRGLDLSRLRKLMDQTGEQLPPELAAYVIGEVLQGLAYAHNLEHQGELISLVHRDVSPHNVILSINGEVKLTDFGVARLSSEDTSGTHVKGKARYMPPEQLRGESRSPTVDLFAAGAVLHEMLDGRMFRCDAFDDARLLGMAIDGLVPPLRRRMTGALEELRKGLLERDPELRIHSAHAALELLYRWPGYGEHAFELGVLVKRYLELSDDARGDHPSAAELGLGLGPGPGAELGHQSTLRKRNPTGRDAFAGDDVAPPAGLDDLLSSGDFTTDDLSFGAVKSDAPLDGSFGPVEHIDDGQVVEREIDRAHQPTPPRRRPSGAQRTLTTGDGLTIGDALDRDTEPRLELEPQLDPPLELDRQAAGFVRHVPTSPNPTLPRRRWGKWLALSLGLAGLGVGGWWLQDVIELPRRDPTEQPSTATSEGMRKARVIGDDFAGYAGFRLRNMDKLASADILYSYVGHTNDGGPLAALVAGEAEFALISLDQLLLAVAGSEPGEWGKWGKIVALVDVSLGGDALVLDTKQVPQLRSLAELDAYVAKAESAKLAYAAATPSETLDLRLTTLLDVLADPRLQHDGHYGDVRAVYDALLADAPDGPIAALLWEPWVSQAIDAGMTVAVSTRDLPDTIVDVLVASPTVLAEQPDLVDAVVGAYYAGILTQQADPEQLRAAVASSLGLTPDEAARTLAGLCLLDAVGAEPWLVAAGDSEPLLRAAIDATWTTLRSHGRVEGTAPRLDDLIDTRALVAAAARDRAASGTGSLGACLSAAAPAKSSAQLALGRLALPGQGTPYFLPGDASLPPERADDVAVLADRLHSFNTATVSVEITGWSDGAANKSLAQARATALVDALQRAGVQLPLKARAGNARNRPAALIDVRLSRTR